MHAGNFLATKALLKRVNNKLHKNMFNISPKVRKSGRVAQTAIGVRQLPDNFI
jgi:hypothetical protein